MIEVKAFKPSQNRTPTAEESYRKAQEEPAASRWPAALAAIILAVAGYLRSLTTAKAEQQPEPDERTAADEPAAESLDAETVTPPGEPEETNSLAEEKATGQELGSGAPGTPMPGLADFMGIDSPPIDYEQLPLSGFVRASLEFGVGRGSNDNGVITAGGSWTLASQAAPSGFSLAVIEGGASGLPAVVAPFNPVLIVPDSRDREDGDDDGPVVPQDPRGRNRAPRVSGTVQLGEIGACQTLLLTLAGLLVGATDADADTLSVSHLRVSSGTITLTGGGWEYRPTAGYYGPVVVSYGVTDGSATVAQAAVLRVVERREINGTPGDDVLTGTDCADLIRVGSGHNIVDARAGNDIVLGGPGNDHILAGAGDDTVYGGAGNDVIHGGAGDDRLFGEAGDDRLFGEAGNDQLFGGAGNDELSGGDGNDTLSGGEGDDVIEGGAGDDTAYGDSGNDRIDGSDGNDTLYGNAGADHILGGPGNDSIYGGDGDDIISAGDGDDEIDGGNGDNIMDAGSGQNRILASNGNNTVTGGSGDDQVQLGAGRDVVRLGGGNDSARLGAGNDVAFGEEGNDTLVGEDGNDHLDGGEGDDTIAAGKGDDTVHGRKGDDVIDAGDGDDEVDGGEGDDIIVAGKGDDDVEAGADDDVVFGDEGDDTIIGEAGEDRLDGGEGDDIIDGGEGDDVILGGSGDDCLEGGGGNDVLRGEDGDDCIRGGDGDDTLQGDAGDDRLDGGEGEDTLDLSETEQGVTVDLTKSRAVGVEIGEDTVLDFEALIGGSGDDHLIVGEKGTRLTGGDGDDRFQFEKPPENDTELIHQILDLEEGDRIIVKQYEIRTGGRKDGKNEPTPFSEIYNDTNETERPFRFRIEKINDEEKTFIDVYITQETNRDFTIEIFGAHKLFYY